MGRSGTTQDLKRIERFLRDVEAALRNHTDHKLKRIASEAGKHERKTRRIVAALRRNWQTD